MRIKKLELVGFKSFKDRTVIHFDAGITGVVGPNGCGKSNIVDALVWVMGEMSAKHLRGSSMEDVIFAGAEGYAPLGMCEVSLTLENDGGPFPAKYSKHSEIMLTRRLHRSGESEYLVNKESARLKDIQEVFMDTGAGSKGFSIIEQGAIGKIITAKPEDRRTLIEEAAGITKFKVRKRESQRKLESTDQNLLRLQDILGEQKRQLDSLQRQAQRAERYRLVKNELRDKELWLSSKNFLKIDTEAQAAAHTLEEAKQIDISTASDLTQKEAQLEELKLKLLEVEKTVEGQQAQHGEAQALVQKLEYEIRELRFEIEQARRNEEMTGSIVEQYKARKMLLTQDQERFSLQLKTAAERAESLTKEYEEKHNSYNTTQERIRQVDNELTERRREMLTVSQSESHIEAKIVGLQDRLGTHKEKVDNSRLVLEELNKQKSEFEKRRGRVFSQLEEERQLQLSIMHDVESFEANMLSLKTQLQARQIDTEQFKDALNEVSSRLYGLENLHANFEGFQEGVKNIMLWQRQKAQPRADGSVDTITEYQPLAEMIEVPEKYEMAMEAALGQKLQLLLTESQDKALSALDFLKQGSGGRSSLLVPELAHESQLKDMQALRSEAGVVNLLMDVVELPSHCQASVQHFMRDVVVVDGLRTALRLRAQHPQCTFVTLEGDTLSSDGVITGGSSESAESGVLKRRREIKELSQKREEWAGKLALAQAVLKKTEAQVKTVSEELENSRKRQYEKEVQIAELKKDLERAENEFNNALQALQRQSNDLNKDEAQLQSLESELQQLNDHRTEITEKKLSLEVRVEVLSQEYKAARDGIESLQQQVTNLQVQSASSAKEADGLRQQLEMVERSLGEVTEQLGRMTEESSKNAQNLSVNQLAIEGKKLELEYAIKNVENLTRELSQVRNDYEVRSAQVREIEMSVSQGRSIVHQAQSRMSEAQLKLEQLRMREQYLLDQVMERYMLNLREEAPKHADAPGDMETIEKEVAELKSKISKIGEVNLAAIEEYDDLIKRYEFLNQQFTDLTDSKEQLKKVIDRINRICSRRFKETFDLVNERFTKVFPVLFGGGEARLILVEDVEKGEMGIDIVAKPPGKKLQSVSLLSGGEKALTAVSLIFSIFLVKPSPYCLLDEVDAPLDDANVSRFNDLVREMAKRSQIIVVTHNKHSMRVASKLYGVTMEEKGVSKMVAVDLAEAERVASA